MEKLTLTLLTQGFCIHRLPCDSELDPKLINTKLVFIARTEDELSILCPETCSVSSDRSQPNWRGLMVNGPLAFEMIGVLSGLATCLANRQVSIFAVSTFDTDYLFIQEKELRTALQALEESGYGVNMSTE